MGIGIASCSSNGLIYSKVHSSPDASALVQFEELMLLFYRSQINAPLGLTLTYIVEMLTLYDLLRSLRCSAVALLVLESRLLRSGDFKNPLLQTSSSVDSSLFNSFKSFCPFYCLHLLSASNSSYVTLSFVFYCCDSLYLCCFYVILLIHIDML